MASIFVPRDHMLDTTLERLAVALEAEGHRVVMGERIEPGEVRRFDRPEQARALAEVDVAVLTGRTPVGEAVLAACPRLRGIVGPAIGVEFVDLDAASRCGILVANGATIECVVSTAEASVMLMLMLLYRPDWSQQVMHGTRARPAPSPEARWARMLLNKKVGLIGYGNIASRVAERLHAFGARIVVADYVRLNRGGLPTYVSVEPLDELLATSDIVSLHAKAVPNQPSILGRRELALMKRDAYLVNTARGALVDERALYEVLAERRIAGAALDTFEIEPLPRNSPLRTLDNVLLTPHMVSATSEQYASFHQAALDNIHALLEARIPPYCVNRGIAAAWRKRWAA
jgi:phosphoglycerate dehydrogenase-like enzyme